MHRHMFYCLIVHFFIIIINIIIICENLVLVAYFSSSYPWKIILPPKISCSSSLFCMFLRTILRTPTTVDITAIFILHELFCYIANFSFFVWLFTFLYLSI